MFQNAIGITVLVVTMKVFTKKDVARKVVVTKIVKQRSLTTKMAIKTITG